MSIASTSFITLHTTRKTLTKQVFPACYYFPLPLRRVTLVNISNSGLVSTFQRSQTNSGYKERYNEQWLSDGKRNKSMLSLFHKWVIFACHHEPKVNYSFTSTSFRRAFNSQQWKEILLGRDWTIHFGLKRHGSRWTQIQTHGQGCKEKYRKITNKMLGIETCEWTH